MKVFKDKESCFNGVELLLESWLAERQALIEAYCLLCESIEQYKQQHVLPQFCQLLIDYVCAGHFEVYQQLSNEAELFGDTAVILDDTLPKISKTTDTALRFQDSYGNNQHTRENLANLPDRLAEISYALAERFMLEDQLIQLLHTQHIGLFAGAHLYSQQTLPHYSDFL